jgi:hypothetical protein
MGFPSAMSHPMHLCYCLALPAAFFAAGLAPFAVSEAAAFASASPLPPCDHIGQVLEQGCSCLPIKISSPRRRPQCSTCMSKRIQFGHASSVTRRSNSDR